MENFTAGRTAARAKLHQVIGLGEQVEVVFDHDDGVALVDQAVQHADELLAVAQVQADGRLLEKVEVVRLDAARALGEGLQAAGEFTHQLETLGLAARERGTALAEREVAEAAIAHEPAHLAEPGVAAGSRTETYAALKVEIDNWRWAGVPFYLRSGKRLARRTSEIAITFRRIPHSMFPLFPADEIAPVQIENLD